MQWKKSVPIDIADQPQDDTFVIGIKPPARESERSADLFRLLDRPHHVCALQLVRQQGIDDASLTQSIIELAQAQPGFLGFALINHRMENDLYTYWESMDGMCEWHRDLDVLRTLSPASDRWFGLIRRRIAEVEPTSQPCRTSPIANELAQDRTSRRWPSIPVPHDAHPTNMARTTSGS